VESAAKLSLSALPLKKSAISKQWIFLLSVVL
jgi:hypothetical protein